MVISTIAKKKKMLINNLYHPWFNLTNLYSPAFLGGLTRNLFTVPFLYTSLMLINKISGDRHARSQNMLHFNKFLHYSIPSVQITITETINFSFWLAQAVYALVARDTTTHSLQYSTFHPEHAKCGNSNNKKQALKTMFFFCHCLQKLFLNINYLTLKQLIPLAHGAVQLQRIPPSVSVRLGGTSAPSSPIAGRLSKTIEDYSWKGQNSVPAFRVCTFSSEGLQCRRHGTAFCPIKMFQIYLGAAGWSLCKGN